MTLGITGLSDEPTRRRDRNRYYVLLEHELARLALSEAEACAVVDAMNGTVFDATSYRHLVMSMEDACRLDGLDEKWGFDGDALVARLEALTPGQCWALVDAVERFWARTRTSSAPREKLLREVGLVGG